MRVFTDAWIQELRRNYENAPVSNRPYLYFVAVSEECETLRQEIEGWMEAFPIASQEKLIPRLRSPKNYLHTYHELVVGNLLAESGYQVEYEKPELNLPIDWFVYDGGKDQGFLVEVFTTDTPQSQLPEMRQIKDLMTRLQAIPIGVALDIRQSYKEFTQYERRNKNVVSQVRRWLESEQPPIGASLKLPEITFEVIFRSEKYHSVQCIGPGSGSMVDKQPMRKRLDEKVHKYKYSAGRLDIPFFVSIIADFLTGLTLDDINDTLFGQEAMRVTYEKLTGRLARGEITRENDGLFFERPELSGVLWVDKTNLHQWYMNPVLNPIAMNPLTIVPFNKE